jgi:hypothetical protein
MHNAYAVPSRTGIEMKVRHVRSAWGVETFHLPVGSPIVDNPYAPHARLRRAVPRSLQSHPTL